MDMFSKKAEAKIKEAEKKLAAWSLFTPKQQKEEDAAELYVAAANQYKTGGEWKLAGDTYIKSGELFKSAGSHEDANSYMEAGKCLKKVSTKEALAAYNLAIQAFTDRPRPRDSTAARLCKEMGEILEKESKYEEAAKAFKQSSHFYLSSDQPTNANHQLLRTADLYAKCKKPKWLEAVKLYEKVSGDSLDNRLLRRSVVGYFFKAGLCLLAHGADSGDIKNVPSSVENYKDLNADFGDTPECKFLEDIIPLVEEGNEKEYKQAVRQLNKRKAIDDWTVDVLVVIQESLKKTVKTDELDLT
mmetsp:Transcript_27173/g.37670  ORF Transcript_27173/g.37670 Transcript_27173/m.37670 type:complete len:301 (-) Transcript_27173:213-1115(-)|eukprot:jgi/Bigna1/87808/estExt_fgenesh1_pg.C_240148